MTNFTHYLVTRFNIQIKGNGPEYIPPAAKDESWEEERIPLFKKFCVPSVLGQSCRNFKWLIYCDRNTTDDIIHKILEIVRRESFVEIHLVQDFQEMLSHLKSVCSQSNTPFLITSRLDNDDAIGKDYIQEVQSNFMQEDRVVLNFLGGVNYQVSLGILTHVRHKETNHFGSLIEAKKPADETCTIMGFSHLHPEKDMIVKNIFLKYAFWITLHDRNTGTRYNRGWPVFKKGIVQNYGLDPKEISLSFPRTILYTLTWLPGAMLKKIKFIMFKK